MSINKAGDTLSINADGYIKAAIQITGTFVATLVFEGTVDGTNWFAMDALPIPMATTAQSATGTGAWEVQEAGLSQIRVRCSAYTSGSAQVTVRGVQGGSFVGGLLKIFNDVWDSTNHLFKVSLATLIAGEDLTNNVLKVEERFSYFAPVVVDSAVKSGAGFVHSITISQNDAAPTAGTIDILDSTSAGAGTKIFSWNLTTAVFVPFTVILDCNFTTGLYIDFTTTGDVNVQGSYR